MFIRIKRIGKQRYGYLVENSWGKKGTRQKVKEYLGKILDIDQTEHISEETQTIWDALAQTLILAQFTQLKPTLFEKDLNSKKVRVDIKHSSVQMSEKEIVLKLNEGYLCKHTIKELHKISKEPAVDARAGQELAQALIDVGIKIKPQTFVQIYKNTFGKI